MRNDVSIKTGKNMKFTERNGLNLSEVNKEILQDWDKADLFHKSMSERAAPSSAARARR